MAGPGRPKKVKDVNPELVKALKDIENSKELNKTNPIDESNKDDFLRELGKIRKDSIPKMQIARVREGAMFKKSNEFAAGYDIKAFDMTIEDGFIKFKLGIKSAAPKGYYWELVHRSGNSAYQFILANTKGTIDCDFRGEWQARLKIIPAPQMYKGQNAGEIHVQQRIGTQYIKLWEEKEIALQAILHKEPEHEVVFVDESELSETERGDKGHGSTGNGLTISSGDSKTVFTS